MSNQADIRDIQILGDLKTAFGRFGEDVLQVLAVLEKQFEEIQDQLEQRQEHWQQQVDAAQEAVYEARRFLNECESQPDDEEGGPPDCSSESEHVSEAEKDLTRNEENLETVKQWRHRVESQIADFQNDMHRLSNLASSRTSSVQAFLADKIEILNRYVGGSSATVGIGGLQSQGGNGKINAGVSIGTDRSSSSDNADDVNNRRELEAIANDPNVKTAIDLAWNDSNPNLPGAKKENGFWILRDDSNGTYSVQPFLENQATNSSIKPGPKPTVPGQTTIAFFHTHPNTKVEGFTQGPSKSDIKFANDPAINIPGILRAHDRLHYFGPALPPMSSEGMGLIENKKYYD